MSTVRTLCCVLTLFLLNTVQCKKLCDFTDSECMTKAGKQGFKVLVKGIKGKANASDPLYYYDDMEGEVNSLKYKLTNTSLTGLANCDVTRLKCNIEKSTFEYFLRCPQWILKSDYELKGPLATFQLNGKGPVTVTSDDYIFEYRGEYEKFIDETDHTLRVYMKDADIKTEHKGSVDIDIDNLIDGDKKKSEEAKKYFNENWREIMETLGKPVLNVLLNKMKENFSDAMKLLPVEKFLPE